LTLKADNESWGDYTESQLYEMITEIYSYVFEVVVKTPCPNDEHRVLFLDLDPSKAMNIEASAKEHIKSLQRRIRTKITIDVEGKVSGNLVGASLIVPMQLHSSLSQTSSVPSGLYSLRRSLKGSRSSPLWRVSLKMVLPSSVRRTTCCHCLLVPLSSFPSVSLLSPN
jgi:hypothetical protein